jgi:hypothetical protein
MADADDRQTAMQTNVTGPRRARGDMGEVESHRLPEQIMADRYLASASFLYIRRGLRSGREFGERMKGATGQEWCKKL